MSVLIRGMQMPEGCIVCPFAERIPPGRTRCLITCRILAENYNAPSYNRPGFCPLVDLGSHGDLIDKDVLLDDLLIHADSYFADFARLWTNKQPVVIEAEGAEE